MTSEEAVNFCKNTPEIAATILMKLAQLEEDLMKVRFALSIALFRHLMRIEPCDF